MLFGGVLLGSVVPVVPTGALVGAAAAFAMTADGLNLPLVLVVATLAAWIGDVVTFSVCRFGGPSAVRWVSRGQHADRIEEVREQFREHGWQIIVIGRLLPAGRIPVLLAAGALTYPWRRLLPRVAQRPGREQHRDPPGRQQPTDHDDLPAVHAGTARTPRRSARRAGRGTPRPTAGAQNRDRT